MKRIVFTTCLVSTLLTLGLTETLLEDRYVAAKAFVRHSLFPAAKATNDTAFESNCSIPATADIAPGSTLIIGHAYGAPSAGLYDAPNEPDAFISEAVENFIREHAASLSSVVFSGDLFKVPSLAKWERLSVLSKELKVSFHIAPGNHDVGQGDNSNRDIWAQSDFALPETGSTGLRLSGFDVFLEDSVITGWKMAPQILQTLKDSPSETPALLVRHNITVHEMLAVANSRAGFQGELPGVGELASELPSGTTVISGDTGAFPQLPRLACLKKNGVRFIANGIGDVRGDVILVLHEGELYQTSI